MATINEVQLNFENLVELDEGRINRLLMRHIQRISQDCMDRPTDKTKRKVILEFTAEPVYDPDTRECESVKVEIECKSKVPVFRSKTFQMRVTKAGLRFNPDFPDQLDQPSLYPKEDDQ